MGILVTGATGNIGAHVVTELLQRGLDVRAFTRDAERAARKLGSGVEIVQGDFTDPGSLRRAISGYNLLVLSSSNHPRQADHEIAVIDAAAEAGVQHVVKLSTVSAEIGSRSAFFDAHGRAEQHLRASGLPHVILQSSFYMTNLFGAAQTVKALGKVFAPAADARVSMIDPRDVARVAAAALVTDRYDGQVLQLSGPEAITYGRVAEVLSEVTGRQVDFIPVPDEVARQNLVASGVPEWFADQVVILFSLIRAGAASAVTNTVEQVTASAPRGFAQFARDFVPVFQPDANEAPAR
jgi:uncharacterized protein YbjT (DUF2867 family)